MNTQLVESLVKVINSLSEEEQNLLQKKLQCQSDEVVLVEEASAACDDRWEKQRSRIFERAKKIHARRGGKPFKLSATEIIHQMRKERDEQLMQACFPQDED